MINNDISQTDNGTIEKYCYDNDPANCATYGGLYRWNEIMEYTIEEGSQGICPTGWHIPSYTEWNILVDSLGGDFWAGGKLKETGTSHWVSPNTGASNECGFTALPSGKWVHGYQNYFYGIGKQAYFWSSSEDDWTNITAGRLYLSYQSTNSFSGFEDKDEGFSVRCIKD